MGTKLWKNWLVSLQTAAHFLFGLVHHFDGSNECKWIELLCFSSYVGKACLKFALVLHLNLSSCSQQNARLLFYLLSVYPFVFLGVSVETSFSVELCLVLVRQSCSQMGLKAFKILDLSSFRFLWLVTGFFYLCNDAIRLL